MFNFLSLLLRIAVKVGWFALGVIAILGKDLDPPRRTSGDDDDDEIGAPDGWNMGRTLTGNVEPSTTSARGESVGLFSGTRINS